MLKPLQQAALFGVVLFVQTTAILAQDDSDFEALFESSSGDTGQDDTRTSQTKEGPSSEAAPLAPVDQDSNIALGVDEAPPPPPPKDVITRGIEEIVVTATKRERSVRDIAASISALSGEMMENAGMQRIDEIIEAVPGVNLVSDQSGNSPRKITIRGIAAGPNTVDTVGIFIDETPFSDVFRSFITLDTNPFDMASVEVLKGPVGTLFGGSSLNGAIRFIPQPPILGEWETRAYAEMRSFADGGIAPALGMAMNIPLFGRDDLALRIMGTDVDIAGYIDSVNQTYQKIDHNKIFQNGWRGILRWMPNDKLDMSLMYIHQSTKVENTNIASESRGGRYESTTQPQPTYSHTNYQQLQLKGSYSLPFADLIFVHSSSEKGLDAFVDTSHLADGDPAESTASQNLLSFPRPRSQELRLVSTGDGRWDWLVGLFNYKYVLGTDGVFNYAAAAQNPLFPATAAALDAAGFSDFTQSAIDENGPVVLEFQHRGDVVEQAMFSEVNWRFATEFELTAGVRIYRFEYDVMLTFDGAICLATDPACAASGLHSEQVLKSVEKGISPKLSIKWDPADNLMAYATVSRGFRFGGVNEVPHPEVPAVFEADSLWNYELGLRSKWFNDTLIADVAAFMIQWDNAQFSNQTSDGVISYTDNVGAVDGLGAEGQLLWFPPIQGLNFSLVVSNADIATAEDFNTGAPFAATTPKGQEWPRSPRWQTATTVSWTQPFRQALFSTSLNHNYTALTKQNFGFNPHEEIFGYSTYGFQLGLKQAASSGFPDVMLNINNLTGKRGSNFYSTFGPVPIHGYTAPRSVSLRLSYQF